MGEPNLARKCIGAHGARAIPGQSTLTIPLIDTAGAIHGLQYISAEGTKKFQSGVTGHFFLIGEPSASTPCHIAEGFATAASIQEAMGGQAAVAFNAGNLKPVAQALRRQWPDRPLVLCADDDAKTSGNPGLSAVRSAAQAVGGTVAAPNFGAERPDSATDFNDLALSQGPQAVRDSIQQTASAFPALDNLVAMTMNDPGYPFRPEVAEQLSSLRTLDSARFEALRAELKAQTKCRVTQLDRAVDDNDPSETTRLTDRLVAVVGGALHDWDDVFLSREDRLIFADLKLNGRRETWPVDSDRFRSWLTMQYFSQTGDTPGLTTLHAVENLIRSQAHSAGRQRSVCIRSGAIEGKLYLDLCDEAWQCVEISKNGWQMLSSSDCPVSRYG